MKSTTLYIAAFLLTASGLAAGQRPNQGPPGMGGPPRAEGPVRPGQAPMAPDRAGPRGDWFKFVDTNKDQKIDMAETMAAADELFDELDKDHSGTLDASELRPPQRPDENRARRDENYDVPPAAAAAARPGNGHPMLPPFFFMRH
ncbi:MAG: hypothetical protein ABJA02_12910, partial [Acidobacteriota bacterium]